MLSGQFHFVGLQMSLTDVALARSTSRILVWKNVYIRRNRT